MYLTFESLRLNWMLYAVTLMFYFFFYFFVLFSYYWLPFIRRIAVYISTSENEWSAPIWGNHINWQNCDSQERNGQNEIMWSQHYWSDAQLANCTLDFMSLGITEPLICFDRSMDSVHCDKYIPRWDIPHSLLLHYLPLNH